MDDGTLKSVLLEKQAEQKVEIRTKPPETQTLKVNLTHLKQQNAKNIEQNLKNQQNFAQNQQNFVQKQQKNAKIVEKNQINFFGGAYQDKIEDLTAKSQAQPVKASSSVIEKPNYDFIEPLPEAKQEKIFQIEKKPEPQKVRSPLLKKLKIITFALLFGVLGAWTVFNAVEITQYDLKLSQYLMKLGTLDSASNMNDLFPTYSEEGAGADGIEKQTNWFDRFCNFMARFFGG